MRARFFSLLRKFLIAFGAISLVAIFGLGIYVAHQVSLGNKSEIDTASIHDVRFVLNWCELGEDRIEKVIRSYVSSRSFTGDHVDAYAIKISRLNVNELAVTNEDRPSRWYRGDQLPPVVNDAVEFAGTWSRSSETSWFPSEHELRSANVYVYPVSTYYHGSSPTAIEIIFLRPSDKMIFYLGVKT